MSESIVLEGANQNDGEKRSGDTGQEEGLDVQSIDSEEIGKDSRIRKP